MLIGLLYTFQALALAPADPIATSLLALAMESAFWLSVSPTYSQGDHISFPGLNPRIAEELDQEVALADRELAGTGTAAGRGGDQEMMSMEDDDDGERDDTMQLGGQTEGSMMLA
jgi:hypothetical protein